MITRYGRITPDILDRIWEKIDVQDGCWIWTDSPDAKGYPRLHIGGRKGTVAMVHVLLYEMEFGRTEFQIGHTHCYNRLCVSPLHKTEQTQSENQLDKDNLRTGDSEFFVCGHPRTEVNSYKQRNTSICRMCNLEKSRQRYYV